MKLRLTYNKNKPNEVKQFITDIKDKGYSVLSESKPYVGRGTNQYNNIYLDIEKVE